MSRNLLLERFLDDEREILAKHLEEVSLTQGFELSLPRTTVTHCYFPTSGIISTVVRSPNGNEAEIGVIGREGMSPASAVLGSDRNPFRTVVQVKGEALRIPTQHLWNAIEHHRNMRRILYRWSQVFTTQIAYTALSHSLHIIDVRLARWLLMCHDRIDGDRLSLTHEFLAIMLAVRRPSVTESLHVLEGKGFIYSQRGLIIMRNREAMEAFAADAYGASEHEYSHLLPRPSAAVLINAATY